MRTRKNWLYVAYAGATVALLAQAADFVRPNIKLGLWEVTNNPQVSGQIPIPEDQLAKLSPEQRAKIEAMIQNGMADAAKPHVYQECMTEEKLARGFATEKPGDTAVCKKDVISSSTKELHIHEDCSRPDGKTTVDILFQVSGSTQMTGKIDAVMTSGSKSMHMQSQLTGKWLGASCGTVKDTQVVK
jgi:Protein of unknown function (DUF3617)